MGSKRNRNVKIGKGFKEMKADVKADVKAAEGLKAKGLTLEETRAFHQIKLEKLAAVVEATEKVLPLLTASVIGVTDAATRSSKELMDPQQRTEMYAHMCAVATLFLPAIASWSSNLKHEAQEARERDKLRHMIEVEFLKRELRDEIAK